MKFNQRDLPGTADPEIIELYEQMRSSEEANCPTCLTPSIVKPAHFLQHSILETDGGPQLIVPTGASCGGKGRRFDVVERQFVGYSHCTCDSCF